MQANTSAEIPAVTPARVPVQQAGPAGHGANGHTNGAPARQPGPPLSSRFGENNHQTSGNAPAGPPKPPLSPSADGKVTSPPPAAAARPGQDAATGKFLPGNKFGRGNPHYRRLAANRTAFLETVGPEQVKELAAQVFRRALAGDLEAAKIVLAYAIGRPGPAADPDRADLDEWQLLDGWPTLAQVMRALMDGAEVAEAVGMVQGALAGPRRRALPDRVGERRTVGLARDVNAEQCKRSGRKQ
jgi:hypothetical protein